MFESNKSCEESQEEMSGVEILSLSGKIAVDQRQEAKHIYIWGKNASRRRNRSWAWKIQVPAERRVWMPGGQSNKRWGVSLWSWKDMWTLPQDNWEFDEGIFIKLSYVKIGKQELMKTPGQSRLKMGREGGITKHRGSCHWRWRRG